ncbi:hypothetical protein ACVWYO_004949 [Sphingomonas sp. UYP23]
MALCGRQYASGFAIGFAKLAMARGDASVLTLGVDADDGERIFEQVGDDRTDALPVRVGAIVSK